MNFNFIPYSNDQRKQYINCEHLYSIYIEKLKIYHTEYKYSMFWQDDRLVKKHSSSNTRKYLGTKDDNTIKIYDDFIKNKKAIKEELDRLKDKIATQEKFNKFYKINRTPTALIKVMKKINELDINNKMIAIGTNSLYAFESYCGVFIQEEHLATFDIDLLSKKNKKLSLIIKELLPDTKLSSFLHQIDKSFQSDSKVPYRFINKDGVIIDLINPIGSKVKLNSYKTYDDFNDIVELEMDGMQWLENSKLFTSLIIGDDGSFTTMTTIAPLNFAIYKYWLSNKGDREPIKRSRDLDQAKVVTKLIDEYILNIDISSDTPKLKHFKKEVVDGYLEFYKDI